MSRHLPLAALCALCLLAACARPLSPNERAVAESLFGPSLDTGKVQITAGLGLVPLPRPHPEAQAAARRPTAPPPGLCDRHRSTRRVWTWPAAFVMDNTIYFAFPYYSADAFAGFPASAPFPASVLLVHELTHVWQRQNAGQTGYSMARAAGESLARVDPYWFEADPKAAFLSYGYEQQAAMVQDFVCYALFDRTSPRLADLAAQLRPVLPVDGFLARLAEGR
ncbi:MAG: hypothetical protein D6801_01610 [Alphaproteobacteria bacterium]|nr:MAG: hypothetical protein D6801_01610 [Alphaproteobacteria bacterium]